MYRLLSQAFTGGLLFFLGLLCVVIGLVPVGLLLMVLSIAVFVSPSKPKR